MANDMNSAMDAIKGLLGDNADEKLQSIMNSLTSQPTASSSNETIDDFAGKNNASNNDNSMEYLMKMKNIVEEIGNDNDPRTNLLMSLRPYMRDSRKESIDGAIRILSLSKFSGLFNGFLGK